MNRHKDLPVAVIGERRFPLRSITDNELPVVAISVHITDGVTLGFDEAMSAALQEKALAGDMTAVWAHQMILELQRLWIEATDKLNDIKEITR